MERYFDSYEACPCTNWAYTTYKCHSNLQYGLADGFSTEAKAESDKQKMINDKSSILTDGCWGGADYRRASEIFCSDQNLCPTDMSKRFITVLDNYVNSLEAAVAEIHGLPNWANNPGTVSYEYTNLVENKLREGESILAQVAKIDSMGLDFIQNKIDEITKFEDELPDILRKCHAESANAANKKTEIKLPCTNGNCPPGYTCVNGFCDKKVNVSQPDGNKMPCSGNPPPGYTCKDGFLAKNDIQNNPSEITIPCTKGACPPGYGCHLGNCEKGYIPPMGTIEGKVLCEENKPVKNASVSITNAYYQYTTTTNNDGFYKVQVVAEGQYTITSGDKFFIANVNGYNNLIYEVQNIMLISCEEKKYYAFCSCLFKEYVGWSTNKSWMKYYSNIYDCSNCDENNLKKRFLDGFKNDLGWKDSFINSDEFVNFNIDKISCSKLYNSRNECFNDRQNEAENGRENDKFSYTILNY